MKTYSMLFLCCFVSCIDAGIKEKFISLGAHAKKALISGKEMMHAGMKEKALPAIKRVPGSFFAYGKGLKNDIVALKPNKASMKSFVKAHPFLAAKMVQESLGFLTFVVIPPFVSETKANKSEKSIGYKFKKQFKLYSYKWVYYFLQLFLKYNACSFFHPSHPDYKENHLNLIGLRYLPFPFISFFARLYTVIRGKPQEMTKSDAGERGYFLEDFYIENPSLLNSIAFYADFSKKNTRNKSYNNFPHELVNLNYHRR